jgi:hypothetical protein
MIAHIICLDYDFFTYAHCIDLIQIRYLHFGIDRYKLELLKIYIVNRLQTYEFLHYIDITFQIILNKNNRLSFTIKLTIFN